MVLGQYLVVDAGGQRSSRRSRLDTWLEHEWGRWIRDANEQVREWAGCALIGAGCLLFFIAGYVFGYHQMVPLLTLALAGLSVTWGVAVLQS